MSFRRSPQLTRVFRVRREWTSDGQKTQSSKLQGNVGLVSESKAQRSIILRERPRSQE